MKIQSKKSKILRYGSKYADDLVVELDKGGHVFTLTNGLFSVLDIVRAVINLIGPSSVKIMSFGCGVDEASTIKDLRSDGSITDFLMILDRGFVQRLPEYADQIIDGAGVGNLFVSSIHAKIALVQSGDWFVVVRGSMNLNKNIRIENVDIEDNRELFEFVESHFNEIKTVIPPGIQSDARQVKFQFNSMFEDDGSFEVNFGADW
jgi:hypothetical protein